jgi:DNA replicative helicase MCM subunit Mcm2 (Cdc46/Mcm family)
MNILKFIIFFVGIITIEGFFFRKNKKESLEYGRSFAQVRALTYKELHEKQMKEKEEKELIEKELKKKEEVKKEDDINKNIINIMFDL